MVVQIEGDVAAVDFQAAAHIHIGQQGQGVAILQRRDGVNQRGVVGNPAAARRHRSNVVTDRKFHDVRDTFVVILGRGGLGVDIVGVIAFLVELVDHGVLVDLGDRFAALILRIPSYCFVLCIVVRHRSVFLHAADGQKRKELFAHRTSRPGKRYGQIGIGLIDVSADLKFFFARLELVLRCGFADQRDLHSDGMPSRVCGIERLHRREVRPFLELDLICAVCERQVDRDPAAVRRAVIAATNGIGLAYAPDLRPRVLSGDVCAAAPFCRASGGYIDPTALAGGATGWYKDSTALATGLTAADDAARYASVLSLGKSRCGQKRQAKHEHHK